MCNAVRVFETCRDICALELSGSEVDVKRLGVKCERSWLIYGNGAQDVGWNNRLPAISKTIARQRQDNKIGVE